MSYHCIKSDCQKRGQTSSIKRNFRCEHCEPNRTDASHYIVALAAAYVASEPEPSRSSSYDSGSSYSGNSDSGSSDNSFSGGGGDSGGGGASGSFGSD